MNFIILADKYNKGMKSKGCLGLLKVQKRKNIFQFQYQNIKKAFPKCKIIYVYGFDNRRLEYFVKTNKHKDVTYLYNKDYDKYNFTQSIGIAKEYLKGNCFITFGDIIFKHQIFEEFNLNIGSQVFVNKKTKNKLGCTLENNQICNISFDLDNYLSNIYYIHKKDIQNFAEIISNDKYKNCFIFEIINKMIDNNKVFKTFIKNNKNIIQTLNEIKIKI